MRKLLRGSRPVTVTAGQATAGTVIVNGPCRLMGWSFLDGGTGYAATISDSGQLLAHSAEAANGVDTQKTAQDGLSVETALIVQVQSGTLSGVVWVRQYEAIDFPEDSEWQSNPMSFLALFQPELWQQTP